MSLEGLSFTSNDLAQVIRADNTDLFFEYYLNLKNLVGIVGITQNHSLQISILHSAVRYGDSDLIRYLIQEGVFLFPIDGTKMTPIELAISLDKWDLVSLFLKECRNFSIDYVFADGHTLLGQMVNRDANGHILKKIDNLAHLVELGANPFPHLFEWLTRSWWMHENGQKIQRRNELLRKIVFMNTPDSKYPIMVPQVLEIQNLSCLLNDPIVPHQILNWLKFNPDHLIKVLEKFASHSGGMTLMEAFFLNNILRRSGQITEDKSFKCPRLLDILMGKMKLLNLNAMTDGLSLSARNMLVKSNRSYDSHDSIFTAKTVASMSLIDAVFEDRGFWRGEGIWSSEDDHLWIDKAKKWILPFLKMDLELIKRLMNLYDQNNSSSFAYTNIAMLITCVLEKNPDLHVPNFEFKCCKLLNYCCRASRLSGLIKRILETAVQTKTIGLISLQCSKKKQQGKRCTGCGDYHDNDFDSCGSVIGNLLQNYGHSDSSLYVILSHELGKSEFVDLISREQVGTDVFNLMINSGSSGDTRNNQDRLKMSQLLMTLLDYSALPSSYQMMISGQTLKKFDQIKPFKLVVRQDPISGDDLQEIEPTRLVLINQVTWDLENLVQYVTKVVKGKNMFDPKHPLVGRPIWTEPELRRLYENRTRIPRANFDRVTNLRSEESGGDFFENRDFQTYGQFLKNYIEIGSILENIDRSVFEEFYRIGSILWAHEEPFLKAIEEVLTPSEVHEWKTRFAKVSFDVEMPGNIPESMSRKLLNLKMVQLANLDILLSKMKQNSESTLAISKICFEGYSISDFVSRITDVLVGGSCVMTFGSNICRGYARAKAIWTRLG